MNCQKFNNINNDLKLHKYKYKYIYIYRSVKIIFENHIPKFSM
mgnify:CR=1 FL=1